MCIATVQTSRLVILLPCLLFIVAVTTESSGQVIQGTVIDTTTSLPVSQARVVMLDGSGDTVTTTLSTQDGGFRVDAPRWGPYVISILRIGYQPLVRPPVRLEPGDTLQFDYQMQPLAYPLSPVVIEAESNLQYARVRYLQEEGFFRRQRALPYGRWLGPEHIEKQRLFVHRVADYMVGLPKVQRLEGAGRNGRRFRLGCGVPKLWVDGNLVMGGGLDQAVHPLDVLAIEIYDGAIMGPPIYGGCSVVVWTRRKAQAENPQE